MKNIKQIIKEEINDFDWVDSVRGYESEAEQWFMDLWYNKLEGPITRERYPNRLFYKLNGKVVIEQDNKKKNFWTHYGEIWGVFETKFELNRQEIRDLMKGILEERLNLEGYTPGFLSFCFRSTLEERLNLEGEVHTNHRGLLGSSFTIK
jgi:hypothetical protein